jgi:NADH-quinone oxidoreductase subunit K
MNLASCLVLAAALFAIGVFGLLTRRNLIAVLISLELMVNASLINFVAFARFGHPKINGQHLDGQIFTLFIIVLDSTSLEGRVGGRG